MFGYVYKKIKDHYEYNEKKFLKMTGSYYVRNYLGEDFDDEGGVSRTTSFSPFATSAACLFESGLELFLKNRYVDMRIKIYFHGNDRFDYVNNNLPESIVISF